MIWPHHSFKHWNSGPLFINFGYLALVLQTWLEFWPYVYKHWNSGPILSNFEIQVLFLSTLEILPYFINIGILALSL